MRVSFPQFRFNDFKRYIESLNRKAEKFGQDKLSYKITGRTELKHRAENGVCFRYTQLAIEISGITPKAGDFTLTASIEHDREKFYIFNFGDHPEYNGSTHCDHCKKSINRKYLYLLKNNKTGEHLQVGKTCVRDFTGHDIKGFIDNLNQFRSYVENDLESIISRDTGLATEIILAYCISLINEFGYKKAHDIYSTRDSALRAYDNDDELSNESIALANKVIAYFRNEYRSNNEFGNNLINSCSDDFINRKFVGILAYAYVEYRKQLEYAEKLNKARQSQFFGEAKKRYELDLKFVRSTSFDSYYGVTYITTFEDSEGSQFVWKSTNGVYDLTGDNCDEALNKIYKVKFTVKNHTVYNEINQTNILRAKLVA